MTSKPLPVNVLLSHYHPDAPNEVLIVDEQNKFRHTADALFMKIYPNSTDGKVVKKDFQGDVVYANFGREEDFRYLNKINVSVLKTIILIRIKYQTTVYDAVKRALDAGAEAVILFADPLYLSDNTYFLNPALLGRLQTFYEEKDKNNQSDNCVAVIQIGTKDAEKILNEVSEDHKSTPTWKGKLNTDYNIGPGFMKYGWKLRIKINLLNIQHTYYNIISAIRGCDEPDRYVLLGSNREMLLKQDIDHLGSAACMMELVRVLGQLRKSKGWVPRRSLVFCNWGLQGDGHFNSEIWARQYTDLLKERAVAYISLETAVTGNEYLSVEAVPLLQQAVHEASSLVPNPNRKELSAGQKTIFDSWIKHAASHHNTTPMVANINGEGDYQMFLHEQGVPSLDFSYAGSQNFVDYNFTLHRAVTELWAILMWTLADSTILPFQVTDYAKFMKRSISVINSTHYDVLKKHNITLDILQTSINEFSNTSDHFASELKELDQTNSLRIRIMNDKMAHLERTLLCSSSYLRHKILWEGVTRYTGFGQLHMELMELEDHSDSRAVLEHIDQLKDCLHSASLLLQDSVLAFTAK
ncbi:putative N-acetylated-alpha-linked acidic dipeptidase isoform X2 [Lycorma delicatula]